MKLRKLLYASSALALLAGTATTFSLTSCSGNKQPTVNSVEVRCATINLLTSSGFGPEYTPLPMEYAVNVYHFNGSQIGYINVDDYVNTALKLQYWYGEGSGLTNYSSETKDGITTITNDFTLATCKINFTRQTMTFSDYDAFLCYEQSSASPLAVGCGGGERYYHSVTSKYTPGKEYVIDLAYYNIKAYYYKGHGYIPFDIFRNMINPQPLSCLFYNGSQFYEVYNANGEYPIELYKEIAKDATVLVPEYMEYTYNLLALTLDHRFGLKYRPSRVNPGTIINYFPNGAYAELRPYHDRIVSLEPDVSNDAIVEFFATHVDDGGHAGYGGVNLLTTKKYDPVKTRGPEKKNTFATQDAITPKREAAKFDAKSYWSDPTRGNDTKAVAAKTDHYYEEMEVTNKTTGLKEKVAYVNFDGFDHDNDQDEWTDLEKSRGRALQVSTNKNNSWKNTMRLTMYAADQISNNNIKNVVIDISNNGGGTVYTEHFIASWLCGGVTEKIYNPHTNAYCEYTVKADIDGDGRFDQEDYLPADVRVFVITTAKSFSCGNMLPCNLADNRPSTVFIGQPSGGGACFVDSNMHIGLGNVFRSSSNYHMLRNASTYNNYITVESGCPNDYFIDPFVNPEKLYNRDRINDLIVNGF